MEFCFFFLNGCWRPCAWVDFLEEPYSGFDSVVLFCLMTWLYSGIEIWNMICIEMIKNIVELGNWILLFWSFFFCLVHEKAWRFDMQEDQRGVRWSLRWAAVLMSLFARFLCCRQPEDTKTGKNGLKGMHLQIFFHIICSSFCWLNIFIGKLVSTLYVSTFSLLKNLVN